jgi:transketolase
MSQVFGELLLDYAERDPRIFVVEADLMRAHNTSAFMDRFPDRFLNVGVAEANMAGVSAGLSAVGKIPFMNSFAPFASRRLYDQVFVSIAYAHLNVKITGTSPGVCAGVNGGTHMSYEDIALYRCIPGMIVFEPVDGDMLERAFPDILEHCGPVYIRLDGKTKKRIVPSSLPFQLGRAIRLMDGGDVVVFASGIMVEKALQAAKTMEAQGVHVGVVNIHTIKPIDRDAVISAARATGAVVVAENHSIINGLAAAVMEVLAENYPVPVKRVGIRDHFGEVGSVSYLEEKFGLLEADIISAIKEAIALKN